MVTIILGAFYHLLLLTWGTIRDSLPLLIIFLASLWIGRFRERFQWRKDFKKVRRLTDIAQHHIQRRDDKIRTQERKIKKQDRLITKLEAEKRGTMLLNMKALEMISGKYNTAQLTEPKAKKIKAVNE